MLLRLHLIWKRIIVVEFKHEYLEVNVMYWHKLPKWYVVQVCQLLCIISDCRIESPNLGCNVIHFTFNNHCTTAHLWWQFLYRTRAELRWRIQVLEKTVVIIADFVFYQHCIWFRCLSTDTGLVSFFLCRLLTFTFYNCLIICVIIRLIFNKVKLGEVELIFLYDRISLLPLFLVLFLGCLTFIEEFCD